MRFWDFGILGFWDFGILGFWDFGNWDLGFGIWDLGFGIWDLGFGFYLDFIWIWNLKERELKNFFKASLFNRDMTRTHFALYNIPG